MLEKNGYKVWIDIEDMRGNIINAMQDAIESSWCVLICASKAYENSTFCKTEAEYAYENKKNFIPIVLEEDCTLNSW